MRDYKKYDVWNRSHELVLIVYKQIVPAFPRDEQFGLANQLKRAAYSIPLNIAEGCGRHSDKDFVHFLDMALGSVQELEYCFLLSRDLNFIGPEAHLLIHERVNEIKAKLIKLIQLIRSGETHNA